VLKVLIVDGNTPETNTVICRSGGRPQGELFQQTLQEAGDVRTTVVFAADCGVPLPGPGELAVYDGIAWTGSALNLPQRTPPAMRQVELARRALLAGAFVYGSCWGLQVAATTCGGRVFPNPRGREIGIARGISLTPEGRRHPLMQQRPNRFEALAVHRDIVGGLPDSIMTVLAANECCPVQAAELRLGPGRFWGVQYHPEYAVSDVASAYRRYGPQLVEEGLFSNLTAVEAAAELYQACGGPDKRRAEEARSRLQMPTELTDPVFRRLEIHNWLRALRGRLHRPTE
jgi:GMP synthase (glutamine-hydrolysing)